MKGIWPARSPTPTIPKSLTTEKLQHTNWKNRRHNGSSSSSSISLHYWWCSTV